MKTNNKGFSLVEILVSLAIGSIIIVSAYTLLNFSSTSYRHTNYNIKTQQEAEVTSNFIYELLLEATDVLVTNASVDGGSYKTVGICNNYYIESSGKYIPMVRHNFIVYNNDTDKMYYMKIDSATEDLTQTYIEGSVSGIFDDKNLLAEGVEAFSMTPDKLKANEAMNYSVTIKMNKSQYTCKNSVITRNSISTPTPAPTPDPGP